METKEEIEERIRQLEWILSMLLPFGVLLFAVFFFFVLFFAS